MFWIILAVCLIAFMLLRFFLRSEDDQSNRYVSVVSGVYTVCSFGLIWCKWMLSEKDGLIGLYACIFGLLISGLMLLIHILMKLRKRIHYKKILALVFVIICGIGSVTFPKNPEAGNPMTPVKAYETVAVALLSAKESGDWKSVSLSGDAWRMSQPEYLSDDEYEAWKYLVKKENVFSVYVWPEGDYVGFQQDSGFSFYNYTIYYAKEGFGDGRLEAFCEGKRITEYQQLSKYLCWTKHK